MKYTVVSSHAEVLATGQLVKVDEEVDLKPAEQEENQRLIDEGRLVKSSDVVKEEDDKQDTEDDANETQEEDEQ